MNILHTSDWHVGKRLADRERLPEQIAVLEEIAEICEREEVSLVLVAGDVFDTYLPSSEAEEVFFRAVKRIAGDSRAVVIVSGNHDDGVRLTASAPLAEEQGIYLIGNKPYSFRTDGTRPVRVTESGDGYLVVCDEKGEKVYLNVLPYPNEARFREEKTEESFPERAARWISRGDAAYRGDMPHVLLSHLFVAGGKTSESERDIDLGGARAVPLHCLPETGYVALGHLHKPQKLGENVYYSGSPLQYSFEENAEKRVLLLRTSGTQIFVEKEIALRSGKRLVRLEANGVDDALALLARYPDCYLELTLHLTAPLTASETQALRERNEGLVSLIAQVNGGTNPETAVCRSKLTAAELFTEFYRSAYGTEPEERLKTTFLSLLEEEV
ncbi:MAG: exonuclease SbcCD subunit D [Candidatus Gallimonas sp.]